MRSVFYPQLLNGPFGDPALYVRIAHRGKAMLFDCGELAALSAREMLKVDAVFISHAHIDHLIGFDRLLRTFLYTDRQLAVYGPLGICDQIASRLAGYTWNLVEGYPFSLTVREWSPERSRELLLRADNRFRPEETEVACASAGGVLLATPDWTVRAKALAHGSIVSLGFVLEETLHVAIHKDALDASGYRAGRWLTEFKQRVRRQETDRRKLAVPTVDGGYTRVTLGRLKRTIAHCEPGMKITYVTDVSPTTENRQQIVELARGSHLLVIEAPFAERDRSRATERHHLTARLAGEIAREAGVERLQVFHHSPRYQDEPELLRREAMVAFAGEGRACQPTSGR